MTQSEVRWIADNEFDPRYQFWTRANVSVQTDWCVSLPASGAAYVLCRDAIALRVTRATRGRLSEASETFTAPGTGPSGARTTSTGSSGQSARLRLTCAESMLIVPGSDPPSDACPLVNVRVVFAQGWETCVSTPEQIRFRVFGPLRVTVPARPRTATCRMRPPTKRTSVGRVERNRTVRIPSDRSDDLQLSPVSLGAAV